MKEYEVLVVGGGPAGLTAALYASRSKLTTICIEKSVFGGQAALTNEIENYSGFPEVINGLELSDLMKNQAAKFGTEFAVSEVKGIEKSGDLFIIQTGKESYTVKTVILSMGASPQPLGCEGEEEFRSRGVSYCATCDGPFFEGLRVAVVGGGDAAVEEAIFLTKYADKVTVIHRRDRFRASKLAAERALSNPKIEVRWNSVVKKIYGEGLVEGLTLASTITGAEEQLSVEGVFIFVGATPNTAFLGDFVKTDEKGCIVTDEDMHTNVPGVFAAGDVRAKTLRQVCTAVADGAIAAMQAEKYIEEQFAAV